jgi:hypothetical protein
MSESYFTSEPDLTFETIPSQVGDIASVYPEANHASETLFPIDINSDPLGDWTDTFLQNILNPENTADVRFDQDIVSVPQNRNKVDTSLISDVFQSGVRYSTVNMSKTDDIISCIQQRLEGFLVSAAGESLIPLLVSDLIFSCIYIH